MWCEEELARSRAVKPNALERLHRHVVYQLLPAGGSTRSVLYAALLVVRRCLRPYAKIRWWAVRSRSFDTPNLAKPFTGVELFSVFFVLYFFLK